MPLRDSVRRDAMTIVMTAQPILKPAGGWVVDMRHYLDDETGDLPSGIPERVLSLAIDARVEPALEVHVVLDNLSAHRAPAVHRWLLCHPRFHLHFTPAYASWLNLVERFFGLLTEKALRRGSHTSVAALREVILAYVAAHNDKGKPFTWTKTADDILDKCAGLACGLNRCMPSE